jgi:predicted alpha/beta superfamily hydrolase
MKTILLFLSLATLLSCKNQPVSNNPQHAGTIVTIEDFESVNLNNKRNLYIYLPPDYHSKPFKKFPVFYMHDGQNLFDTNAVRDEWRVDETMEDLIAQELIPSMIVVGISNTPERLLEYNHISSTNTFLFKKQGGKVSSKQSSFVGSYTHPWAGEIVIQKKEEDLEVKFPFFNQFQTLNHIENNTYVSAGFLGNRYIKFIADSNGLTSGFDRMESKAYLYGKFMVDEVMPYINENYRTLNDKGNTGIGGSSMGGLVSLYLGMEYSDTFGKIAAISPSIWWHNKDILNYVKKPEDMPNVKIWMDMGTNEDPINFLITASREMDTVFRSFGWNLGKNYMYKEYEDAVHYETDWAQRFPEIVEFLFSK